MKSTGWRTRWAAADLANRGASQAGSLFFWMGAYLARAWELMARPSGLCEAQRCQGSP